VMKAASLKGSVSDTRAVFSKTDQMATRRIVFSPVPENIRALRHTGQGGLRLRGRIRPREG